MVADDFDVTADSVKSGNVKLDDLLARKYVPELKFDDKWKTAPTVTGEESAFSNDPDATKQPPPSDDDVLNAMKAPPVNSKYTVSPTLIREAENTILGELKLKVEEFERFRSSVTSKAPWIFIAGSAHDLEPYEIDVEPPNDSKMRGDGGGSYTYQYKDEHPGNTTALIYAQELTLKSCGDALELAGEYVRQLNNAAQYYVQADKGPFSPPKN